MNRSVLKAIISAAILATAQVSLAGEVTGLTSFSAGTPARASEVNGNFTAVKTAVDDNHARIVTLETNAASPSISGNITLVPSTAATGNILKGTAPFLHNFGTDNTFLGENAGNFTMTGVNNTASGVEALSSNTTGFNNTASGVNALFNNTDGSDNTASGRSALLSNTTGSSNTASGASALSRNTTGDNNTASGVNALFNNTDGSDNTASGRNALSSNTTGDNNTASGRSALESNTTGFNNTASGVEALFSNKTGFHNTASGRNALFNNTTGFDNTASGGGALFRNTIGSGNIAIGVAAGSSLTTGNNNIAIDNFGVAGESNTIRIGDTHTRTFIAGIRGVTTATAAIPVLVGTDGQLGTASSSRRVKDDIADMGKASNVLMRLRPVTFHYKTDRNPKKRTLQYGLVAEEVAAVAPNLVALSAKGEIETVYYQHLTPMLLNEYQKQQRTIEAQAARITAQEEDRRAQAMRIEALENQAARTAAVLSRLDQARTITAAAR
ncbi:MAG TPA: tail fiber domain-containing protein [Opitutaceae bacterium]